MDLVYDHKEERYIIKQEAIICFVFISVQQINLFDFNITLRLINHLTDKFPEQLFV